MQAQRLLPVLCINIARFHFAMTGERLEYLTDAQVQALDQFILRFTKLQDAMGGRLFRLFCNICKSNMKNANAGQTQPLEKLGYIQSAEAWQNIRNARNKFAMIIR